MKDAIERAAGIFGVPVNEVFPVKNYERETGPVSAVDILCLDACLEMLKYANSLIESKLNTVTDSDSD